MATRLPLSVIVTTIEPWPDLSRILDVLHPQVEAFGGEVIVAASDLAAPEERVVFETPRARWLRRRDSTVHRLRAMAVEIARGEIIATIEDDCVASDTWCAEVMRGFALYPLARALAGVTLDALEPSSSRVRAASRWMSPASRLATGEINHLNANVAYQRSVFPPITIPTGWIERELNPRLLREGGVMLHDEMVVHRVRQRGLPGRAVRLPTGLATA